MQQCWEKQKEILSMKIFKNIQFMIVLLIIILHAIIPHPHSDELTDEQHFELHRESNSLIGIIRLVFHESNDENLDNLIFVKYDYLKIYNASKHKTVSNFNNRHGFVARIEKIKIVNRNTRNFYNLFFVKLNKLRGPPMVT